MFFSYLPHTFFSCFSWFPNVLQTHNLWTSPATHTRSEVTEGALQVWRTLPERIRQDPSLASFRQEHERLHGGKYSLLDKDLQEVEEQQPALLCFTTFVYLVSCLVAAYD